MSKKTNPLPPYTGKLFTPGDYVLIQRPHLWSGASGKVEVVDPKTGIHQIRVTAKDGVKYPSGFRADALGDLLVLELENERLERELTEARQAHDDYVEANRILTQSLSEAQQERASLQKQLEEARRQIELDTANVARIQNACIALEVERDSLRQQLEEAKKQQPINTNYRLFDLVRYMRSELHQKELITDEEYSWLMASEMAVHRTDGQKVGSPSPRRLEDYDRLHAQNEKFREAAITVRESIRQIAELANINTETRNMLRHCGNTLNEALPQPTQMT